MVPHEELSIARMMGLASAWRAVPNSGRFVWRSPSPVKQMTVLEGSATLAATAAGIP